MITTLTDKQISKFQYYVDKWLAIGLDTTPYSLADARPIIDSFYTGILKKPKPDNIIILNNPIEAWYAVCLLSGNKVKEKVGSQVGSQVGDQVWDQVGSQVGDQVGDQVGAQVGAQVWDQVGDQVWSQVGSQVWDQVESFIWPYADGNFNAPFYSVYDYLFCEVIPCQVELWPVWRDCSKLSLIYPMDNICVLLQKPKNIKMEKGVLHNASGPAISYNGWDIYCLNGVKVPEWLVKEKHPDPRRIYELDNAEVRREFVRKVGLETLSKALCDRVIEEKIIMLNTVNGPWACKYRLLQLKFGKETTRRALEMPNASMPELWHVEYLQNNIETIEQALNFRFNRKESDVDDINGCEWYLHGDVIIKPKNNTKVKRRPTWIA